MLGKARKDVKTKTAFQKKKICDAIVVSFSFSWCLIRSVEDVVLIRLRYTVQHCLMEFQFHDRLLSPTEDISYKSVRYFAKHFGI